MMTKSVTAYDHLPTNLRSSKGRYKRILGLLREEKRLEAMLTNFYWSGYIKVIAEKRLQRVRQALLGSVNRFSREWYAAHATMTAIGYDDSYETGVWFAKHVVTVNADCYLRAQEQFFKQNTIPF